MLSVRAKGKVLGLVGQRDQDVELISAGVFGKVENPDEPLSEVELL